MSFLHARMHCHSCCERALRSACQERLSAEREGALQTTLRIKGHDDDVNAVAFMDDSSNLIASGSDDTLLKVRAAQLRSTLLQSYELASISDAFVEPTPEASGC